MAKFYMMGNYTTQGFQGFLKDPKSDRSKAAQAAADAIGAKMISYTGLRGAYDFCVVAEGTFEQCGSGEVTAKGLVDGVKAGCFPQLYQALGSNLPDQVITL